MFIDHLKSFSALVAACILVFPAAAFLDPAQVQTKTINIPNGMEESKITIKDSWGPPLPDSVRLGEDAYRPRPVIVIPQGWLAYVAQGVMGSWVGNCRALAIQNVDRA